MPDIFAIGDASISATAAIRHFKLQHRHVQTYAQSGAVATETAVFHQVYSAGTLLSVKAVCNTAPTTTDTVSILVKKSTGGGAYTNITSALTLNNSSIDRVSQSATITDSGLTANDVIEIVVTASGTSAQDLGVTLVWVEG